MTDDSDAVRAAWAARDGEHSPGYYAHYGATEASEAIRASLDATVGRDAAVLELGCSAGRHLAHLHDHGYTDLTGIEINRDARSVLTDAYPGLADAGTFHFDAIEAVVPHLPDGAFDAAFSVETLQHIHRDATWVFEEIARVTDGVLITVEIEDDDSERDADVTYVHEDVPLYYRDWNAVFTDLGLTEIDRRDLGRDTLRVFRAEPR